MRATAIVLWLAACGRLDFAPQPGDSASVPSYSDQVFAAHPLAYYRLNETAGSLAYDITGHHFDANMDLYGGSFTFAVSGATGDLDTALRVSGDGNAGPNDGAAIYTPVLSAIEAGEFSVEMFAQPDASPPVGWRNALFICEHYLTNGFRLGYNRQHELEIWTDEAGSTSDVMTTATIDFGRFNHIVLVHAGSTFTLYLGGQPLGTMTLDYQPPDTLAECGFGALHGMPTYTTFDEVAIYDRALSATEIANHAR